MYVIVKNDKTVISHGLNKDTWKYLDECREAAIAETNETNETITVCELKPLYSYSLELACKEIAIDEPADEPTDDGNEPTEDAPTDEGIEEPTTTE